MEYIGSSQVGPWLIALEQPYPYRPVYPPRHPRRHQTASLCAASVAAPVVDQELAAGKREKVGGRRLLGSIGISKRLPAARLYHERVVDHYDSRRVLRQEAPALSRRRPCMLQDLWLRLRHPLLHRRKYMILYIYIYILFVDLAICIVLLCIYGTCLGVWLFWSFGIWIFLSIGIWIL